MLWKTVRFSVDCCSRIPRELVILYSKSCLDPVIVFCDDLYHEFFKTCYLQQKEIYPRICTVSYQMPVCLLSSFLKDVSIIQNHIFALSHYDDSIIVQFGKLEGGFSRFSAKLAVV